MVAASPSGGGDGGDGDNWGPSDDRGRSAEASNGDALDGQDGPDTDYARGSSPGKGENYREKQVKPNKVYIGGLPENTRINDLESCFGQIGHIVDIELKVGYGFVEFDNRAAAEESVAKYHEGHFMGNKIRVELSHGGGRTAKYSGDPGACFKCGQAGHWARECPNSDSAPPPPSRREFNPNRDRRDHPREPPSRDSRYDRDSRDYRRGQPPPQRDFRDFTAPPPPSRGREYDDYRRYGPDRDQRYGLPPPPDYRGGRYPPSGYPHPPPPPPHFNHYDRRGPRDDYERAQRDYVDYRGRPPSPLNTRYDYRGPPEPGNRYRRRSQSPHGRPGGYDMGYHPQHHHPSGGGYSNNGYSGAPSRSTRDYAPAPARVGGDNYRRS